MHVSEDKSEALPYINLGATKGTDPRAYFFLGKAYHLLYKFGVASGHYKTFKSKASEADKEKYQVDLHIRMCASGKKLLNNLTELVVEEKTRTSIDKFPYSYDLSQMGGRIIISEEFQSKIDEKRGFRSMTYIPPLGTGNDVIFYASYGKKGESGLDLYARKRLPNGDWGEEQRLPDHINTPYDDAYGFLHASKTVFYFCSKGHNSMGGYDIFKCSYDLATNTFGPPVNLDYKINTPDDDIMYVVDSLEQNAYFASGRVSKYGYIDVYKVRVETFPLVNILLAGNFDNKIQPGDNAVIKIKDDRNDEIIGVYNPKQDGKYTILLPKSGNYTFIVETDNSEKIHQSPVVIPPQKEFKPLKQKIILTNENGVEQLIIQNLFDEEFSEEEREALLADAMQSMADPQVNIDEYEDVLTQDDKDSILATNDNFTLDDIEGMAKEFYEDAQEEADKLKNKMEAAFAVANQKSKEAAENAAAAEEIVNALDEIENPLERQQQADLAKELNNKAKDQYVQATTAYNLANGLKSDHERAQNEANESKATYESIQGTLAEKDHEKAIAQLTELKERIEGIISNNSDSGAGDELYAEAKSKKKEANEALAEAQEFRAEEEKLNLRVSKLKGDLEKAKEKDKPSIQVQIDELEEQVAMNKKWADETFEKAERLDEEASALDHQAQLLMDLDSDIANVSGELTDSEVAELEKFMNDNSLESGIENNEDVLNAYAEDHQNDNVANNNSTSNGNNLSSDNNDVATNNTGNNNNNNSSDNSTLNDNVTDTGANDGNETNTNNVTTNNVSNENTSDNSNVASDNQATTNTSTESVLTPDALTASVEAIIDENELDNIENDPDLTETEKLEKENEVLQKWVDAYDYKIVEANKGLLESANPEDRERFKEIREDLEVKQIDLESRITENNNELSSASLAVTNDNISEEYQDLITDTEEKLNGPEDYSTDLSDTEAYFSDEAAELLEDKQKDQEALSILESELVQLEEDYESESKEKKREKIQEEIDTKKEEIVALKTDLGTSIYEVDGAELEQNDTELVEVLDEIQQNVEGYESDENYLKAEIYNNAAEEQRKMADEKADQASRATNAEDKAQLLEDAHALNSAAIDNQREAISLLEDMTVDGYDVNTITKEKSDNDLAANNSSEKNGTSTSTSIENDSGNNNNSSQDNTTNTSDNGSNEVVDNSGSNDSNANDVAGNTTENPNDNNPDSNGTGDQNGGNETADNTSNTGDNQNNNTGANETGDENSTGNDTDENAVTNNTTGNNNNNGTAGNVNDINETVGNDLTTNNSNSNNTGNTSGVQSAAVTIESINNGTASITSVLDQQEKQSVRNVPDQEVLDKTYDAENDNPDAYEVATVVENITYSNQITDFDSEAADEVFSENEKVVEKINDLQRDKNALNLEAQNAQTDKDREKIAKKVVKIDGKIEKQESKLHEDIEGIAEAKIKASKNNLEVVKESFGDVLVEESTDKKQSEEYESKADELVESAEDLRNQAENEKNKSAKNNMLKEANSKELEAVNYYDKAADFYVDAAFGQQDKAIESNESVMSADELTEKSEELRNRSSELMSESVEHRDSALLAKGQEKIKMIQRAEDKEKQANTLSVLANEYQKSANQQSSVEEENIEKENLLANLSPEDVENVKSKDQYQSYFDAENEINELKIQKAQKEGEKEGLENIVLQQSQDLKQLENEKKSAQNKQEENEIQEKIAVIEDAIIANEDKIDELEETIESLDVLIGTAQGDQDNLIAGLPTEDQNDIRAVMVSNYDKTPIKKTTITIGDLISSDFVVPDKVESDIIVLDQNIKYSDDNPIPLNPKYPDGLIYKVQVGAFSKPIPNDVFSGFAPITGEQVGNTGLVRYRVGYFVRYDNANDAKNQIRGFGYSDAFVVAIYDGEKITLAEARNIEQQTTGTSLAANNATQNDNNQNNGVSTNNADNGNDQPVNNGNNTSQNTNNTGNNGTNNNAGTNNTVSQNENNDVIVDLGDGAALTTNADKVEGLFYTVQLGAFSKPIKATDVYNISPLVTKFVGNLYKYSTGIYRSVEDAVVRKNEVVALGNTDAFVTVYYNGERITIAKAQELIAEQGESIFAASENGDLKQLSGNGNTNSQPENNTSFEIVEVVDDGDYYVDLGTYEGEIPTDLANAMLMVPEYTIEVVSRGAAEQYYVGFFNTKEDAQKVIALYSAKGVSNLAVASMSEEETSVVPAPYPGIIYRVYLGNYQGEVPGSRGIVFVDLKDEGVEKVVEDNGSETYYAGKKSLFSEAEVVKKKFTSRGVNIAEVKAFRDGEEIPVEDAKQLTHE